MKNKIGQKIGIFILVGGISAGLYFLLIGIYTRISADPIIFFASLFIAVIVIGISGIILWKTGLFDPFTLSMVSLVYLMGIIMLTVFGPTFIDRSISYHIAFYAVDEQKVDIDEMRQAFSQEIFIVEKEGVYEPTWKAELMTFFLKPIGEMTGSLDTYKELKEQLAR